MFLVSKDVIHLKFEEGKRNIRKHFLRIVVFHANMFQLDGIVKMWSRQRLLNAMVSSEKLPTVNLRDSTNWGIVDVKGGGDFTGKAVVVETRMGWQRDWGKRKENLRFKDLFGTRISIDGAKRCERKVKNARSAGRDVTSGILRILPVASKKPTPVKLETRKITREIDWTAISTSLSVEPVLKQKYDATVERRLFSSTEGESAKGGRSTLCGKDRRWSDREQEFDSKDRLNWRLSVDKHRK